MGFVARELPKICVKPSKCCGARARNPWHHDAVTPTSVQCLAGLCPAIKKEWADLLNGEPTITPLGRPDTLVYLMDATLAQLFTGLEAKSTHQWLRRCAPLVGPVHGYCACGLNPLLKYFTTGEIALRAAAGAKLGTEIEEVLQRFRLLAQQEIETLCSVCQYKGTPGCSEIAGRASGRR